MFASPIPDHVEVPNGRNPAYVFCDGSVNTHCSLVVRRHSSSDLASVSTESPELKEVVADATSADEETMATADRRHSAPACNQQRLEHAKVLQTAPEYVVRNTFIETA